MVSFIAPPYPDQLLLQHIPTAIALLGLAMLHRFVDISRAAFICMIAFLCLHLVGARYIYSYVPYDSWSESLFGVGISELLGWRRNNYDRLVHFGYGLLLVRPALEILRDRLRLSPRMSRYVAVEFIMASSMVYELADGGSRSCYRRVPRRDTTVSREIHGMHRRIWRSRRWGRSSG